MSFVGGAGGIEPTTSVYTSNYPRSDIVSVHVHTLSITAGAEKDTRIPNPTSTPNAAAVVGKRPFAGTAYVVVVVVVGLGLN